MGIETLNTFNERIRIGISNRRTLMNSDQAAQLAKMLREGREALHMSASELARRAGVAAGTVTRIELCQIPRGPLPESLAAMADVLGIARSDVFAVMGWVPPTELPTLRPYLRTKYHELPEDAVTEVEQFIQALQRRHGGAGPTNGEDEL
jgi:transcriptional regulator with XRE-family HTH domain